MNILKRNNIDNEISIHADCVYAGAYLDQYGFAHFNWKEDRENDIVYLNSNPIQEFKDGVRYVYAFQYNPKVRGDKIRKFRNYIKNLGTGADYGTEVDDSVEKFIERGIDMFDSIYDLKSFAGAVHAKPSNENSIVGHMSSYLIECMRKPTMDFELIKNMYNYVMFDDEKTYKFLIDCGYTESEARYQTEKTRKKFEQLKRNKEGLFQIKRFVPREVREGFYNFLRFKSKQAEETYRKLQGVDLLLYDDFVTSGTTVKEMMRCIRSIHDKNTLTVFALLQN